MPAKNRLMRLAAIAAFSAMLLPAAAGEPRVLVYTDHEPLGGMRTQFIHDVLLPAIERESNGRLKIDAHWGGEVASGQDALRVLGEGRGADMGIVVPEYVSGNLPLHQLFKSFPSGPSGDRQLAFFRRVAAEIPAFSAELDHANVSTVFFATGYPMAFFSAKPLRALDDFSGGKWRSASFWHQDFLRNAGAVPVSIPWGPGVLAALHARELDGVMVNVDSAAVLKVQDAAPNVLIAKELWMGHAYLLVMNKASWNGLTREDRQAIERAGESAYKVLGGVMDSGFDAMLDTLRKDGATVRVLSPGEVARWRTATRYREVQADWVKTVAVKGTRDAGPVLEKLRAILAEP
ncbi:MAG: TRAP transporter substrate-binding protein DctP [Pseudomonadota bacterium]